MKTLSKNPSATTQLISSKTWTDTPRMSSTPRDIHILSPGIYISSRLSKSSLSMSSKIVKPDGLTTNPKVVLNIINVHMTEKKYLASNHQVY